MGAGACTGAGTGVGLTSGSLRSTTGQNADLTISDAIDRRRRRATRLSASVPMKISEAAASPANSTMARAARSP